MQKEIRDRWTAALRSGEYQQGQDQLRTDGGKFCCLGVLCDVLDFDLDAQHVVGFAWASAGGTIQAPQVLRDLLSYDEREELAGMNDGGHAFTEIADYIDENIPVE